MEAILGYTGISLLHYVPQTEEVFESLMIPNAAGRIPCIDEYTKGFT